jgi:hypothetical protein
VIDLAGELGGVNIVLSKDSGCGPSGSASKTIQNVTEWMVGIKSCSPAHVMISRVHIQYNNPIGNLLAGSRRRESKRMK